MIYPFLPIFARGLGVDLGAMSLAMTARSLVGTLNPFVASFADRRGRKFGLLLAHELLRGWGRPGAPGPPTPRWSPP